MTLNLPLTWHRGIRWAHWALSHIHQYMREHPESFSFHWEKVTTGEFNQLPRRVRWRKQ